MAAKVQGLGVISGLVGVLVWAGSIFLNIPSFLGSSNRISIFTEYVTRLEPVDYILPLAFVLYAVFSLLKQRTASLAASLIALVMCCLEIFNEKAISGDNAVIFIVAVICVILAYLKKN